MNEVRSKLLHQNDIQKKNPSESIEKHEIGHWIGKYRILDLLGQGGNGVVYLAEDTILKKQWAIKQISKAQLQDTKDKILKEASIMKELDHYGIPRITEQIEDEAYVYLVMDYCKGKSLFQYCCSQKVTQEDVLLWGIQLCDILEYLHKQQPPVIFRDMKPANVICDENNQLKLIDFGIAITDQYEKDAKGTKGFAAPEQYKGEYSVQSDIYNLSATLLWCLGDKHAYGLRRIFKKGIHENSVRRYKSVSKLRMKLVRLQKQNKQRKYVLVFVLLLSLSLCISYVLVDFWPNKEISDVGFYEELEDGFRSQVQTYLQQMEYKKYILQKILKEYEVE